jgi:hypothetical protein
MDLCCRGAKLEVTALSIHIWVKVSHLAYKMFISYLNENISAGTIGEIVDAVKVHSTHQLIVIGCDRRSKITWIKQGHSRAKCNSEISVSTQSTPSPCWPQVPLLLSLHLVLLEELTSAEICKQ